jgi:hypothetical protein
VRVHAAGGVADWLAAAVAAWAGIISGFPNRPEEGTR